MRFSELEGARIGLWGAGREAAAFCAAARRLLRDFEIAAVVTDAEPGEEDIAKLGLPRERFAWGTGATDRFTDCDVVVRSPGVSIYRDEYTRLQQQRTRVTTGSDLWFAEPRTARVVGVTGTKGKSTTSALIAHLLNSAGVAVELAGNVGRPLLDLLGDEAAAVYVVELSSFQIADLRRGPDIAVFTNVYREHIDWHGGAERYFADKLALATLPGVEQIVVNGLDERLAALAAPRVHTYGSSGLTVGTTGIERDGTPVIARAALPLPGDHNALNLCAALTALDALGVAIADPAAALRDFVPLPHRLQTVATHDAVRWVNDSISTTPASAIAALECFAGEPLVLIAGGFEREQDYAELARALTRRAPAPVVIGLPATGARVIEEARRAGLAENRALVAGDLPEAVDRARTLIGATGVVLLSPAAPSFGAYTDFEQRGEHFTALACRAD